MQFQGMIVYWMHATPGRGACAARSLQGLDRARLAGERLYLALQAWWGLFTGESPATLVALAQRAVKGGKIWREYPDTPVPPW